MAERQVVRVLMSVVSDGLRVLRSRDGVLISDAQIDERARNITAAVLGLLDVTVPDDYDDCCNDTGGKHVW